MPYPDPRSRAASPGVPVPERAAAKGRPALSVPLSPRSDVRTLARAGADLFYCGLLLPDLRARIPGWAEEGGRGHPAACFSEDQLPQAVAAAREAGRPLHVAMNRPYPAAALPAIREAVARAVEIGVDGFVVSDLALARFIRENWPAVPMTASTFLGLHNPAGLALAARLGFHRVVLPRPMRIREVRALARGRGPGLEVFIARERCRFANAYCRLEHHMPTAGHPHGLCFEQTGLCVMGMVSDDRPYAMDFQSDTLDACGLCAIALLRDLQRVQAVKIVGRGFEDGDLIPFIELARRVLDEGMASRETVRAAVERDGRIRCAPAGCYYPEPPPMTLRRTTRSSPRPSLAEPESPRWAGREQVLYWLPLAGDPPSDPPPSRVVGEYLGHETCAHLLPLPRAAHRRWADLLAGGFRVGLVLPPLFGPVEARRGRALAETLASLVGDTCEVTVNDLGTLADLRSLLGPRARLALGRVLAPSRNDPRLRRLGTDAAFVDAVSDVYEGHIREMAALAGVDRVEISRPFVWPRWGDDCPPHLTVHAGPAILAVARACGVLADLLQEPFGGRPFVVPARCGRPCLDSRRDMVLSSGGECYTAIGNALYGATSPEGVVPRQVDRIVLHPLPPRASDSRTRRAAGRPGP